MSIEAVVGRIGQIIQMQQQLSDPAAASPTAAASDTGTTGSATGTQTFSSALASALGSSYSSASGATDPAALADSSLLATLNPSAPTTTIPSTSTLASPGVSSLAGSGLGSPTATAPSATAGAQVNAMVNEADSLLGKPYVYGGGHGSWAPSGGYDCSGFVSAVLHAGGYLSAPVDTTALPSQPGIEAGPGQYVTIYDRALSGQNGHVIIDVNGQFYESGGSAGAWGGGGGVEKIGQPSAAYLATFPSVLHPSGL
jgi:cell wall-associated NlpC family hydrolase